MEREMYVLPKLYMTWFVVIIEKMEEEKGRKGKEQEGEMPYILEELVKKGRKSSGGNEERKRRKAKEKQETS